MIYIIRVYDGREIYEYQYGNEKHAREHLEWEPLHAELYVWKDGHERLLDSVN